MKSDFLWVYSVITNKENNINHYESINKLIELFKNKWNDGGREFELYLKFLEISFREAYDN